MPNPPTESDIRALASPPPIVVLSLSEALEKAEDLLFLSGALNLAVRDAQAAVPDGQIMLALVSKRADGSGQIGATFEASTFVGDLAGVINTLVLAVEQNKKQEGDTNDK